MGINVSQASQHGAFVCCGVHEPPSTSAPFFWAENHCDVTATCCRSLARPPMLELVRMNTILLVEDAKDLAQVVRRELEQAGFQVCLAEDGLEALAQLEEHAPDLVILDWMLPKLDGLDVLRRLRQRLAAPVLMLTARSDPADRVVGLEMGADDYLVKPFHLSELVARVRALLRRSERIRQQLVQDQTPDQKVLSWHDLTLDPGQHTCLLASEMLDLTRIEFDLLHLL